MGVPALPTTVAVSVADEPTTSGSVEKFGLIEKGSGSPGEIEARSWRRRCT